MKLTASILAAAYDLLRYTEPFVRWNLPEPEDVQFDVIKGRKLQGDCQKQGDGSFRIRISEAWHGRLSEMLGTMGHEMIHLHLDHSGAKDSSEHGIAFKHLAAQVVHHHRDFDAETF